MKKSAKPSQAPTHRTLMGDVRRVSDEHPVLAGVAAVTLAGLAIGGVSKAFPAPERPHTVCVPTDPTPFKGSEYGGTVSGVAKAQLDTAIAEGETEGKIDGSKITDEDYAAELHDLTMLTGVELGLPKPFLNKDRTYKFPEGDDVCVTQLPDGTLSGDYEKSDQRNR